MHSPRMTSPLPPPKNTPSNNPPIPYAAHDQ